MLFTVQRPFTANAVRLERGDVVNMQSTLRTQQLVEQRYLLPADPDVATVSTTPLNEVTDQIVKRRGRPPSSTSTSRTKD